MQTLVEFLKRFNHWVIFILLEVISLVMLFRFNHYQGSVWFTQANAVSATVNGIYTDIIAFVNLGNVNQRLTEQNTTLQLQLAQLREQLADATTQPGINDQHNLSTIKDYKIFKAKVISSSIMKNDNYIVINQGSNDGIRQNMGVIGGGGIVGIVYATSPHYSLVLPLINEKSSINCRVRGTEYFGTLEWTGGNILMANLNGIKSYAQIKKGAVIETSGYSSIFPPGLFVGKVVGIADAPDGITMQLKVNLGTNFGNLRDVNIFQNMHKAEIDTLKSRIQDLEASN